MKKTQNPIPEPGEILKRAEALGEEVVAWRRGFHSHPELSWKEVETSKRIAEILGEIGYKNVKLGFGGTSCGVMADLPGEGEGPGLALRADIDALPVQEATDLPFRSRNDGVMHACGHDAHAAILLGAAKLLMQMRDRLPGSLRLIFQPAEEAGVGSGAPKVIQDGGLEGMDAIFGLHVWSTIAAGRIGSRPGGFMASGDVFEYTIQGKGGHTSTPHLSADPTVAAATLLTTLQTVSSLEIDPLETVVISLGKMEAGTAVNIIPDRATFSGTLRTANQEIRKSMEGRLRRIGEGIGTALRCAITLKMTPIYAVTHNDPELTAFLKERAVELFGAGEYVDMPVILGAEDFSFYAEKIPSVFAFLGVGNAEMGADQPHHSPRFAIDDSVLHRGVALMGWFAARFLAEKA